MQLCMVQRSFCKEVENKPLFYVFSKKTSDFCIEMHCFMCFLKKLLYTL